MDDKVTWIAADGTEYSISDNHLIISGSEGRFMPPIKFIEEEVPFQAGSRLRDIKIGAKEFDLPIYVDGTSAIETRSKIRNLLRLFNPLKGDGKIRITAPDGSQREITCRYSSGLEISERKDSKIGNLQAVVFVFKAFDPFWYDTNTIVETFTIGQPATFFPFFPLRLSSSTVFADMTIDNAGDVETWPEWIVQGPGENIVLRNLTTGEETFIGLKLEAWESLTIDTRPFHKTITKNDGTNLFYTLTDSSALWALQEGQNSIRLEMSDATSDSKIQLSYRNRYWGP